MINAPLFVARTRPLIPGSVVGLAGLGGKAIGVLSSSRNRWTFCGWGTLNFRGWFYLAVRDEVTGDPGPSIGRGLFDTAGWFYGFFRALINRLANGVFDLETLRVCLNLRLKEEKIFTLFKAKGFCIVRAFAMKSKKRASLTKTAQAKLQGTGNSFSQ